MKFLSTYAEKPIYVFGGFGLMSIFTSFLCFGLMLVFKFIPDPAWQKDFVETPLPAVVIMLFLMGFLSMLMGLICELQIRTYYESQDKPIYHISESCSRGTKG